MNLVKSSNLITKKLRGGISGLSNRVKHAAQLGSGRCLFRARVAVGISSRRSNCGAGAADRGDAYAQFNLAGMYMAGVSVHRDLGKAHSLFTSAGKTLDVSKQLSELSLKMNADELAKLQ